MKDREYLLQLISDSLDGELTPEQNQELSAAKGQDQTLVEYEVELRAMRQTLSDLPIQPGPRAGAADRMADRRGSLMRRAWRIELRLPLPLAASLLLAAIAWFWLKGGSTEATEPVPATQQARYIQIERLEPAVAVPAAYVVDSSLVNPQEGEL